MKYLTLLLTLLPFMLTAQQSAPESRTVAGLPPQLEEDVSAGNQEWIEGLKAGDADRIVASYSQDSVFCNAAGDCVRGPAAIAAQYQEVITKFGRATDAVVRSEGLQVDHDLAYEFGSAEAHFANGAVRKGRYSTVWKLQSNGHWKIFRNMSLSAPGA
jgi:ketosteroid isomerase-like protein